MLQKYSVKRPLTVVVAVLAIIILGVVSFMNSTTDLLPKMELPYVVVYTTYPGASPEKVETSVTKPLEQALATTSGIKNINSVSSENVSVVIMEFNQDTGMDGVMIEISSSIDMVKPYFDELVGVPTIMKINPDMLPVVVASVDMDGMDAAQLSAYVKEKVVPAIERLDGVASVTASGLVEKQLSITLSEQKIDALNAKIRTALDNSFAEGEEQLADAEKKLKNAIGMINAKGAEARGQITDGLAKINAAIKQFEAMIAAAPPADEIAAQKELLTQNIALLKQSLATEEGNLAALSSEDASYASIKARVDALKATIAELEATLAQLTALESAPAQLAALKEQKAQLEAAEGQLNSQLNQASGQLGSAQKQIKDGKEQLAEQKEAAIENSAVDKFITADMIKGLLAAENFSMPAGYISVDNDDKIVKVGDTFVSSEEMAALVLTNIDLEGVGEITLSDVADIAFIDNSDEVYAKINGNNGIILSVQKQSTSSTVDVSESVAEAFAELEKEHEGMHITSLNDQGTYINIVVDSVVQNLLYGGILAVLILFLFLLNIKPTAVVAVSIPVSLLFALVLMYFSGVTMNIISLAGLALGVGMLVDNSIVVIENIYRMRSLGKSAKEAAIEGASQVAGAIASSTLTTICVFLPIVFTQGISRQLFTDMGLTIAYSLIASLIVALTVVPSFSVVTLKNFKEPKMNLFGKFAKVYGKTLSFTLKFKPLVLLLAVGLLVFAGFKAYSMGTAFMPDSDALQLTASITTPKEYTTEQTREVSDEFIEIVSEIDGIATVGANEGGGAMAAMVGMSGAGGGGGNSVSYYLILDEERTISSDEIIAQIFDRTKNLDCEVTANGSGMDEMSALTGSGISVKISGQDLDTLTAVSRDIAGIMQKVEGTTEIDDGTGESSAELRVIVDKNKAILKNLTVAQVYAKLAERLSSNNNATTVTIDSEEYPVVVIDGTKDAVTEENIGDFVVGTVTDKDGETQDVKLSDVADITDGESLKSILRDNQVRYITVSCALQTGYNVGLVGRELNEQINSYQPPKGVTLEIEGENTMINEALGDLGLMMLFAIALIYLIMVAQFQSLLSPFIIMFTIPLAFTGGLIALIICGMELSVISLLGFLVLSGVVVNNGIVFVDYTNQLRESGMTMREALIESGKTRMRPILMTALTTILGLSTLAMGFGMGADLIQPMAVVTIGGLIYSTLMTMYVVPVLYEIFNKNDKLNRKAKKLLKAAKLEALAAAQAGDSSLALAAGEPAAVTALPLSLIGEGAEIILTPAQNETEGSTPAADDVAPAADEAPAVEDETPSGGDTN
ncbi:MAG: efflux RND transporter permease subunit [Oscillospiraceae bacterium]|jgi:HAE1 family hydrophobic/amphiphilic exporter-1|nr:efflux RND transporter permease subunit [Oscillospiraceae bacterium]